MLTLILSLVLAFFGSSSCAQQGKVTAEDYSCVPLEYYEASPSDQIAMVRAELARK